MIGDTRRVGAVDHMDVLLYLKKRKEKELAYRCLINGYFQGALLESSRFWNSSDLIGGHFTRTRLSGTISVCQCIYI